MNPYQLKKMDAFFQSPERTERYISRGMAEEVWSFGLEDMLDVIHELLNISWKRSDGTSWGTFSHEQPNSVSNGDEQREGMFPWITFDVLRRTPSKSHRGLKPRQFEHVQDPNDPNDYFRVHRQWYDCEVEFAIFAKTNREAIDAQLRFESLIHQFTGFLKEMGISDIVFQEEVGSKNRSASSWNRDIPHRTTTYLVRVERIIAVRHSILSKVQMEAKTKLLGSSGESQSQGEILRSDVGASQEFLELYDKYYS